MSVDCFGLAFSIGFDIFLDIFFDVGLRIVALDQIQCLLNFLMTYVRTVMEKVQNLMMYSLLRRDINAFVTKQEFIVRYGETFVFEGLTFLLRSRLCLLFRIRNN